MRFTCFVPKTKKKENCCRILSSQFGSTTPITSTFPHIIPFSNFWFTCGKTNDSVNNGVFRLSAGSFKGTFTVIITNNTSIPVTFSIRIVPNLSCPSFSMSNSNIIQTVAANSTETINGTFYITSDDIKCFSLVVTPTSFPVIEEFSYTIVSANINIECIPCDCSVNTMGDLQNQTVNCNCCSKEQFR